jgi:cytochrome P450
LDASVIDPLAAPIRSLSRGFARRFEQTIYEHPRIAEVGFGVLRRVKPILVLPKAAIVTRHDDCREVLLRDLEFSNSHYVAKMNAVSGAFVLCMPDGPQFRHDLDLLERVMPRSELPALVSRVQDIVSQAIDEARPSGRLDIVGDLASAVPARLADTYLGVHGPDDPTLVRWSQWGFNEIFLNIRNDPAVSVPALQHAAEMRAYVDTVIATRKASVPPRPDDVLSRLLAAQEAGDATVDDEWIRTYLIGLCIGMLPLTSKAITLALDTLLRRPEQLAQARAAARSGDHELVGRYLFEAMRFSPTTPGLFRVPSTDARLAEGSRRSTTIASGKLTLVATQSAMFDSSVFSEPRSFRADRPYDQYLHFGDGIHVCVGRYLSYQVQMPLIGQALLALPRLRRAPGAAGKLRWDGPFPTSLHVAFDES